jgi:fructose 1,6-bisphosphate aldolase/phosphatase
MKVTISVIKADVGSTGGHTAPHPKMLEKAKEEIGSAIRDGILIDGMVTHTGDDIALLMSHEKGVGAKQIHEFSWNCFIDITEVAKQEGAYGAGQDLLVDAPSGNLRGAGPAVAEIEFDLLPSHRPAEAFLVFAADKCGPGAYNFALWNTFANPMENGGLLLSPKLAQGFTVTVIDMDYKSKDSDRIITLRLPEDIWDLAALLRQIDRFAVESVYSRAYPTEQIVSVSATRLHNIAGKYTGKDDPVAIFRTQGIFPAPEEAIAPYRICPYVTGDARGSHTMALMPMPVNTPIRGDYCQPIVSCLAFSMNEYGSFTKDFQDMFAGKEWDSVRSHASLKSHLMREQGFFGVAMASQEEVAYTGLMETLKRLDKQFKIRHS